MVLLLEALCSLHGRREPVGSSGEYAERELIEMPNPPRKGYTNLQTGGESGYRGFNPHTLEKLGKHHDGDLYNLLRAVDDEDHHPFTSRAVRRDISSRLRRLCIGMTEVSIPCLRRPSPDCQA